LASQNDVALGVPLALGFLLLGRVNRETNKAPIFQAKSAPKDKNGQPKALTHWNLKNYIDLAHELGWISASAKDVGEVLRDYRNHIHPFKQLSHAINLTNDDALLLWEVSKAVTRQVISSAGPSASIPPRSAP
jgi:hypothetical protein